MHVAIIGAGYVGLTTSACLAELGHDVTCVDIDSNRVGLLRDGIVPIHEPGLEELIRENGAKGRLRFTSDVPAAATGAEIVLLAVGTPKGAGGEADLSQVRAAARMLAAVVRPDTVIAIKSTVEAGTARLMRELIAEVRGALDFRVASNPEFLREGSAVTDFMKPDRIVIGADDQDAGARLAELYRPLTERGVPVVLTGTVNAELIKYAANAFLALKIGYINDVADLCEEIGGDIAAVSRGIGLDPRIGTSFLSPGPGYGGSCFPKDTEAFASIARRYSAPQPLIETLIGRNQERKRRLAARILGELEGPPSKARVALLGLAFKADTDDTRESPALTIAPILRQNGVAVATYDPMARAEIEGVVQRESPYAAADGADVVAILTEWPEFARLDFRRVAKAMRGRVLLDCRNLLDPQHVSKHGLRCVSLGRSQAPRKATYLAAQKTGKRAAHAAAPHKL
jgi:UDPglucose 6-dehydrogenase